MLKEPAYMPASFFRQIYLKCNAKINFLSVITVKITNILKIERYNRRKCLRWGIVFICKLWLKY